MNLLSTLVLIPLIIACLDYLNHLEEANEGVDYLIVYGTGEVPEGEQV